MKILFSLLLLLAGVEAAACSYCGRGPLLAMPSPVQLPWAGLIIAGMLLAPFILFCSGFRLRKAKPVSGQYCCLLTIGMLVIWGFANSFPSFGSTLANVLFLIPLIAVLAGEAFGVLGLLTLAVPLVYGYVLCAWLGRYHIVRKEC